MKLQLSRTSKKVKYTYRKIDQKILFYDMNIFYIFLKESLQSINEVFF